MILFLSKFLACIFYPVGLSCLLALLAFILLKFKRKSLALMSIAVSVILIWIFSMPSVAHILVRNLESKYDPPASFPQASAIVVLGGSTEPAVAPRRYCETNIFGDRMFHAIRLAKAGYAPYAICTGGKIEFLHDFLGSEAATMADILREFGGFDSSSIIIEDQAKNTHDHGPKIAAILQKRGLKKEIILVTSAMHMFRSVKIFKKYGFIVYPAPTDYWIEKKIQLNIFSIIPDANALFYSTTALHEYYGLIAYKLLGWL